MPIQTKERNDPSHDRPRSPGGRSVERPHAAARQHPDVITFDVLPPLHTRGRATDDARTQEWFDSYATEVGTGRLLLTAHRT